MLPWIIAFVVFDLIVTVLVIRHVLAKRSEGSATGGAGMPSFLALRKFTDAIHPRIGELVRSNWSGDVSSLPTVLTQAVDEAQREARAQGLELDREIVKKLVETSISRHGVARGGALREALAQVA